MWNLCGVKGRVVVTADPEKACHGGVFAKFGSARLLDAAIFMLIFLSSDGYFHPPVMHRRRIKMYQENFLREANWKLGRRQQVREVHSSMKPRSTLSCDRSYADIRRTR